MFDAEVLTDFLHQTNQTHLFLNYLKTLRDFEGSLAAEMGTTAQLCLFLLFLRTLFPFYSGKLNETHNIFLNTDWRHSLDSDTQWMA